MEEVHHQQPAPKTQSLAVPIAIVFGFGLIAAAIFFSGGGQVQIPGTAANDTNQVVDTNTTNTEAIDPVVDADHIRGNPNAPIVIVEYSDFDCPYCKVFHETMNRILEEYGPSGEVAWVYRHFPLEQLHPSAPFIAEASECVAAQGDDEAFWTFADLVFGERSGNNPTNLPRLPEFAETAGVDVAAYEACVESQEMRANVEADFNNAAAIGARGTPYSVILIGNDKFALNGARPYGEVKAAIDSLLSQLGNIQSDDTDEATE